VGTTTLYFLTTGKYNVALGWWAGRGDFDSYNSSNESSTIDEYSMFLGHLSTRHSSILSATKLTNANAIGYRSKVSTSNTMVLGGLGANRVKLALGYHTAKDSTFTIKDYSLLITKEAIPAFTDSSTQVKWNGIYFTGTDGNASNIRQHTSDNLYFENAVVYKFDNNVQIGLGSVADRRIDFKSSTNWTYKFGSYSDDFNIYDSQDTSYVKLFYNSGGTGKYVSIRNGAVKVSSVLINLNRATVVSNTLTSTQFRLSAINTSPANAGDTGTAGEIRFTADGIYICTATNTWVKASAASW
jgi:hypothetical protein